MVFGYPPINSNEPMTATLKHGEMVIAEDVPLVELDVSRDDTALCTEITVRGRFCVTDEAYVNRQPGTTPSTPSTSRPHIVAERFEAMMRDALAPDSGRDGDSKDSTVDTTDEGGLTKTITTDEH